MPKILILGGSGFFGTNLNWYYRDRPDVVSLDCFSPQIDLEYRHTFKDLVMNDISGYLKEADIIYYLIGQTSHTRSIKSPLIDQQTNLTILLRVLEVLRRLPDGHKPILVYPSSTSLYGQQPNGVTITEKTSPNPVDIYSLHKLTCEHYINIYRNHGFIKAIVLRFPNCFGPFGHAHSDFGVLNHWINAAENKQPIRVYGNGRQIRHVLYIEDAIRAMVLAVDKYKLLHDGVFNVVDGNAYSIVNFAVAIGKVWGSPVEFVEWPASRQAIELGDVRISGKKFFELTGWRRINKNYIDDLRVMHENPDYGLRRSYRQRALAGTSA